MHLNSVIDFSSHEQWHNLAPAELKHRKELRLWMEEKFRPVANCEVLTYIYGGGLSQLHWLTEDAHQTMPPPPKRRGAKLMVNALLLQVSSRAINSCMIYLMKYWLPSKHFLLQIYREAKPTVANLMFSSPQDHRTNCMMAQPQALLSFAHLISFKFHQGYRHPRFKWVWWSAKDLVYQLSGFISLLFTFQSLSKRMAGIVRTNNKGSFYRISQSTSSQFA